MQPCHDEDSLALASLDSAQEVITAICLSDLFSCVPHEFCTPTPQPPGQHFSSYLGRMLLWKQCGGELQPTHGDFVNEW